MPVARAARDAGHEVVVVTRVNSAEQAAVITDEGFKLIALKRLKRGGMNPWKELLSVLELARIYRQESPDLVYHAAIKPVLYGSLAALLTGVKSIVNGLTGLGYIFISKTLKARIIKAVVRTAFFLLLDRKNSRVIVQNRDDYDFFVTSGLVSSQRIALIRGSGVDVDRFKVVPEPVGEPVVTLVARMLWDKGVGEFVEAVRILKRDHGLSLRALLVGYPDLENHACIPEAQLLAWQDEGVIEYLGKRADVPELLSQSNLVVLPSYREGLPKTLLEAASCGRAIVTTDVPGCREIVRDGVNGLLVPVKDANSLALAIKRLLVDPELRSRMGDAGRRMVEDEFSEKIVVAETMTLYKTLL